MEIRILKRLSLNGMGVKMPSENKIVIDIVSNENREMIENHGNDFVYIPMNREEAHYHAKDYINPAWRIKLPHRNDKAAYEKPQWRVRGMIQGPAYEAPVIPVCNCAFESKRLDRLGQETFIELNWICPVHGYKKL